jgi:hypothetical protein
MQAALAALHLLLREVTNATFGATLASTFFCGSQENLLRALYLIKHNT